MDELRLIIDTDTAGDDATAILLALKWPGVKVEAITINCGNINFDQQVENALFVTEFAGKGEVPVFPGCREPLVKDWRTVENIHGNDGMGDSFFPKTSKRPEKRHAVEEIIDLVNRNPGEITIVEQAPMTNLAMAIKMDKSIANKVKGVYIMGGSYNYPGNVTPAAEFNFWVDPEAAHIVLNSGMPITLVGWDITMKYGLLDSFDLQKIAAIKSKNSEFFININRTVRKFMSMNYGTDAVTCPDSITMAISINSKVATRIIQRHVQVDYTDGISRGASYVDEFNVTGLEPNANLVVEASNLAFKEMLFSVLSEN